MKRIRIAQIGVGHDHASDTWNSLCRQSELFDVIGWCPTEEEAARPIPGSFPAGSRMTLDEIFSVPDLDAVAVETDDWDLTGYAQIAAERGLAVHMDKPGAASQETFEKLVKTVREKGGVLQLGYMYRYNPMIMRVVETARAGGYGEICSVEAHMDCEHGAAKRQWLDHFRGGMLYFLGCHLIDLIVQIAGIPEEIVPLSCCSGYDGVTGEDIGMAALKYKNGVSFAKTSAVEPGGFMRRQLVVTGKTRSVELRPLEEYVPDAPGMLITRMRDCQPGKGWGWDGERSVSDPMNRYDAMTADFAAMARGEKVNPYTLEYECQLHRVILAACGYEIDYKSPVIL